MGQRSLNTNPAAERLNSYNVLANWVETLHGLGTFPAALEQLMTLVKAEAALIARFVDGSLTEKRIAAVASPQHAKLNPKVFSYSEEILGTNLKISQPGATWCWTQTEVVRPLLDRSHTADRLKKHGLSEVVMICLGMRTGTTDYLELQFSHLAETDRNLIAVLSDTLSRT